MCEESAEKSARSGDIYRPTSPSYDASLPMSDNVLIVDDDEHLRKFIARGLSRLGYHAVAAENGKSGIQLLK